MLCYTLSFKKKVLDKLEENGNNIAQTARDFNIHRKNVQRWIVQKELIVKACKNRMVIVLFKLSSINICLHPLGNFGCICASDFIDLKFKLGQFQIELGQKRTNIFQNKLQTHFQANNPPIATIMSMSKVNIRLCNKIPDL